jgi:hypothetical protein|tara:strand:- start:1655 stop:2512 length:858 start_codon:yes stop_codon:yes gene_type:complete
MAIPYIHGQTIKPDLINVLGTVTFTDGTNVGIQANQQQCEAYGYTYNQETGTCSAFKVSTQLQTSIRNENNFIQGRGNETEIGTNNTYIMGENNTVKGASRNNIIIGSGNEIQNGIDNAIVFGTRADNTTKNSIVLGGNQGSDNLGERQAIHLMYGTQTTQGTEVNSYLNNTIDSFFVVPDNTIFYFHADVIAVRVGHTGEEPPEGSLGDYASWVERGVIINKRGTVTVNREKDPIKSDGVVTDWRPRSDASGTNFIINVRGETNTTIEWNCYVRMTEIRTGVTL